MYLLIQPNTVTKYNACALREYYQEASHRFPYILLCKTRIVLKARQTKYHLFYICDIISAALGVFV